MMHIIFVALIIFCTVSISANTIASDGKKKKNDEDFETVIVENPNKTVQNPVEGDTQGTNVNTNDAAKENVERHDDITPEEQAIFQRCQEISKRIIAGQAGVLNSLDSFNSETKLGDKKNMFIYSEQERRQQEIRDEAIAEFQQLGCDDYLDTGALDIKAPAVKQ